MAHCCNRLRHFNQQAFLILASALLFSAALGCNSKLDVHSETGPVEGAKSEEKGADEELPAKLMAPHCQDPDLSKIPVGVTFTLCDGSEGHGTSVSLEECAEDGQVGCVTSVNFPAVDLDGLTSENILAGTSVGGVVGNVSLPSPSKVLTGVSFGPAAGTLTGTMTLPYPGNVLAGSGSYGDPESPAVPTLPNRGILDLILAFPGPGYYTSSSHTPAAGDIRSSAQILGVAGSVVPSPSNCNANFSTNCVANASYAAVETTDLTASNIKSGVSVAGLTGTYPSSGNRLSGADATADLTSGTIFAQLVSTAAFEYFDSSGTRHSGAGDADLIPANIVSGVQIFGVSGTQTPQDPISHASFGLRPDTSDVAAWLTAVAAGPCPGLGSLAGPVSISSANEMINMVDNTSYRLTTDVDFSGFPGASIDVKNVHIDGDGYNLSGIVAPSFFFECAVLEDLLIGGKHITSDATIERRKLQLGP